MKTPQEWDEHFTCAPMNAQQALRSVRVRTEEIDAIQTDARADLLARVKELEASLKKYDDELSGAASGATFDLIRRLQERVKELEVELSNTVDYRAGEFSRLRDQLHQRDTALDAAMEALESCRMVLPKARKSYNRMFARNTEELETLKSPYDDAIKQIDHAISQIQAVKP